MFKVSFQSRLFLSSFKKDVSETRFHCGGEALEKDCFGDR